MKTINILDIMLENHVKIGELLHAFAMQGNEEIFSSPKWEIEKHFFIEEKAIFTFCKPSDSGIYKLAADLMKQHSELIKTMKELEKDFQNKKLLERFERLLNGHKDYEEKTFYPKLESELPEKDKKLMLERINSF